MNNDFPEPLDHYCYPSDLYDGWHPQSFEEAEDLAFELDYGRDRYQLIKQGMWMSGSGSVVWLVDMDASHLDNTIRMLERRLTNLQKKPRP